MTFLSLLILLACGQTEPAAMEPTETAPTQHVALEVWATSHPSAWLAAQLGDGVFKVHQLLNERGQAQTPPSPEQIAALAEADLIVANGAGLETWMATAALPQDRVVYSANNLDLIEQKETTHSHGADGDHTHAAVAPQTWSDPDLFLAQGRATHAALVILNPARRDTYDTNLRKLERNLKSLSMRYQGILSAHRGREFATSDPSFRYLARRYQFQLQEFDLDPLVPPPEEQVAEFRAWAEKQEAPVLLWEQQATPEVVDALGPEVAHLTIYDLLAPPTSEAYDYLTLTSTNIDRFQSLSSDGH